MKHELEKQNRKLRAALYLRVSTDEQAKEGHYGLEVQEELVRGFCKSLEYEVSEEHIYKDDISGGLPVEKRPKLTELFQAAKRKEFDIVVVYKIDRLAREIRILVNAIHDLATMDIGFRSVNEPVDTTSSFGKANLSMFGLFAELEKDMIRDRTMNGRIRAARSGKWVSGTPPYGYRLDKQTRRLVIEPNEAKVVQQLYTWLIEEKLSLKEIERRMNVLKTPAPQSKKITARQTYNHWYKRTIGRILTNEVYTGTFYFRKYKRPFNNLTSITNSKKLRPREEWIEMHTEAIITAERFETAKKQLLHNRDFSARNKKRDYLYAKLIYCSECQFRMFGGFQPPRKKWTYEGGRYYHGTYRKEGDVGTSKRCQWCPQYSEARLEPIWECLKDILKNPQNITAPLNKFLRQEDNPKHTQERITELNDLLENVRKKRERIVDLFVHEHLTKERFEQHDREYARDEQRLHNELLHLHQRLLTKQEQLHREQAMAKAYEKVCKKLDSITYEEKTKIISIFVERITLHAHENYAEVIFKFHSNTDSVNAEPVPQEQDPHLLALKIKTVTESERRAFILRMNPGMYIPKTLI